MLAQVTSLGRYLSPSVCTSSDPITQVCKVAIFQAPPSSVDPTKIDWSKLGFSYVEGPKTVAVTCPSGEKGWQTATVEVSGKSERELGNFEDLYCWRLFEGMKATGDYKLNRCTLRYDLRAGLIWGVDFHHARLNAGAKALGLPEVPIDVFREALHTAVRENKEWLPPSGQESAALYLRIDYGPKGNKLGNSKDSTMPFQLRVAATPVNAYYASKPGGVSLLALPIPRVVAWESSVLGIKESAGTFKYTGNYGIIFGLMDKVKSKGYADGIFTFLKQNGTRIVSEASSSNMLIMLGNSEGVQAVVRPKAPGTLNGCTSDSLLKLISVMRPEVKTGEVEIPLNVLLEKEPVSTLKASLKEAGIVLSHKACDALSIRGVHLAGTAAGGKVGVGQIDFTEGDLTTVKFPTLKVEENVVLEAALRLERIKAGLEKDPLGRLESVDLKLEPEF